MKINKIAAGAVLSAMSAATIMVATATPANAIGVAFVTVSPASGLSNGDMVTITATGFPASDAGKQMYAFQCDSRAVSTFDQGYCDTSPADVNNTAFFSNTLKDGKATGKVTFKVLTGSNFKANNGKGICQFNANPAAQGNTCDLTVADTATQEAATYVGLGGNITFKDTRAATKTVVKAPKTATAGKTVKLKVSETKGATGTVTVYDGKKAIDKKVKLPASGKVTIKVKKVKKGKHTWAAVYSGDKKHAPSAGTAKTKVTK